MQRIDDDSRLAKEKLLQLKERTKLILFQQE